MNIKSIIAPCLLGVANGWVCSPKRIIKRSVRRSICKKNLCRKRIKEGLLLGGAAAAGGAALVVGTGAVGAAVALNQINSGEVYQPTPGSMNNQVVVITGGSTGLGLETAKRLAAAGATIVLTSRTGAKGYKAVEKVKDYLSGKGMGTSDVYNLPLDLDDISNVKLFAESYEALGLGKISVLVNNAGVMAIPSRELTADGYERTFQSNHLGHFVLTSELYPYLSRGGARVINVSSSALNIARPGLDMDNLNGEKSYGAWSSYGTSKLANVLFTEELQRRADAAGQDWLTAVCLHPGVVNTDLWRYIVGEEKLEELKAKDDFSVEKLALGATSLFTKSPEQGASTQIFLAAEDDLAKGAFYDDMKVKSNLPSFATDEDKAKALWEISEDFGAVKFDLAEIVEGEIVDDNEVEIDDEETDPSPEEETDTSPVAESSDEEL